MQWKRTGRDHSSQGRNGGRAGPRGNPDLLGTEQIPSASRRMGGQTVCPRRPGATCDNAFLPQRCIVGKSTHADPICTIRQLSVTAGGASYTMDCETKAFQMKGNVNLVFDGMEHMTANGKIDISMSGKTSSSSTEADYRWKSAACSANDANLSRRESPDSQWPSAQIPRVWCQYEHSKRCV